MTLPELLAKNAKDIVAAWFSLIIGTYPEETQKFLGKQKDQFNNPVGQAFSSGSQKIFTGLLQGKPKEYFERPLTDIVRIRAVQEFSAAESIGFVFLLKKAIRQTIGEYLADIEDFKDLLGFENEIDRLALQAFDIHMNCREQIYKLRHNEIRRLSGMIAEQKTPEM